MDAFPDNTGPGVQRPVCWTQENRSLAMRLEMALMPPYDPSFFHPRQEEVLVGSQKSSDSDSI